MGQLKYRLAEAEEDCINLYRGKYIDTFKTKSTMSYEQDYVNISNITLDSYIN
jgi:penicillin-binding protein-related factor A (putative recombinase)